MAAAKKKMIERARVQSQLEKIQNSISMIDIHRCVFCANTSAIKFSMQQVNLFCSLHNRSTIEGTALDLSVLETLKASGDALKQIGATGQGLRAVEDIVSEVESNLQHAADITSVLSSGSVTGMVNSMVTHGVTIDEEELMRELENLSDGEDGVAESFAAASSSSKDSARLSATNTVISRPSSAAHAAASSFTAATRTPALSGSSSINAILSSPGQEERTEWVLPA
jgi:uncharacterized protein YunC (DUF1805 family)